MAFEPITTQEAFDSAIKARLERNTKTVTDEISKKYEGYVSPDELKKQLKERDDKITTLSGDIAAKDAKLADLTAKSKKMEISGLKTKIAHEKGIPFELAERLSGETAEEITADADALAKFAKPQPSVQPLAHGNDVSSDNSSSYHSLLGSLKF